MGTYRDYYKQAHTIEELKQMALDDTRVAMLLGCNPDRIQAIEDAMNDRAKELGGFDNIV